MFRALHSSPPPPIECGHHPQRALGSQSSPFCLPLPRLLRIRSESGFACPGHFTQVEIPFCGLASVFSPCRVGRVEPRCLTGQSCVPFFGSVMCHVCRHQLCSPAGGHGPFHFGARTEPCCSVCSSFSVNTFPAPLGEWAGMDAAGPTVTVCCLVLLSRTGHTARIPVCLHPRQLFPSVLWTQASLTGGAGVSQLMRLLVAVAELSSRSCARWPRACLWGRVLIFCPLRNSQYRTGSAGPQPHRRGVRGPLRICFLF